MACPTKMKLTELNPHLICVLCGGYLIDATTITRCLHSFCKTCIVNYLQTSNYCPACTILIHKKNPFLELRQDHQLQDIVYKVVPGLFKDEMAKRRECYNKNERTLLEHEDEASGSCSSSSSSRSNISTCLAPEEHHRIIVSPDTKISLALELSIPIETTGEEILEKQTSVDTRYLLCPAAVTIEHLKKFIRLKFALAENYKIDMCYEDEILADHFSLVDVAYITDWQGEEVMKLCYTIYQNTAKKRKRMKSDESLRCYNDDSGIEDGNQSFESSPSADSSRLNDTGQGLESASNSFVSCSSATTSPVSSTGQCKKSSDHGFSSCSSADTSLLNDSGQGTDSANHSFESCTTTDDKHKKKTKLGIGSTLDKSNPSITSDFVMNHVIGAIPKFTRDKTSKTTTDALVAAPVEKNSPMNHNQMSVTVTQHSSCFTLDNILTNRTQYSCVKAPRVGNSRLKHINISNSGAIDLSSKKRSLDTEALFKDEEEEVVIEKLDETVNRFIAEEIDDVSVNVNLSSGKDKSSECEREKPILYLPSSVANLSSDIRKTHPRSQEVNLNSEETFFHGKSSSKQTEVERLTQKSLNCPNSHSLADTNSVSSFMPPENVSTNIAVSKDDSILAAEPSVKDASSIQSLEHKAQKTQLKTKSSANETSDNSNEYSMKSSNNVFNSRTEAPGATFEKISCKIGQKSVSSVTPMCGSDSNYVSCEKNVSNSSELGINKTSKLNCTKVVDCVKSTPKEKDKDVLHYKDGSLKSTSVEKKTENLETQTPCLSPSNIKNSFHLFKTDIKCQPMSKESVSKKLENSQTQKKISSSPDTQKNVENSETQTQECGSIKKRSNSTDVGMQTSFAVPERQCSVEDKGTQHDGGETGSSDKSTQASNSAMSNSSSSSRAAETANTHVNHSICESMKKEHDKHLPCSGTCNGHSVKSRPEKLVVKLSKEKDSESYTATLSPNFVN